jgi:hypothetical protein
VFFARGLGKREERAGFKVRCMTVASWLVMVSFVGFAFAKRILRAGYASGRVGSDLGEFAMSGQIVTTHVVLSNVVMVLSSMEMG